jgi:sorbitol/mannitol transport system permease protein
MSRRLTPFLFTAPAVIALFVWMIVPLALTLWCSVLRYRLLSPAEPAFVGLDNYRYFLMDSAAWRAMANTLVLVGSALSVTVVLGIGLAVLFDHDFFGRGTARLLLIAPFLVMPTVSALIWKNLIMHPVNGVLAFVTGGLGFEAIDWLGDWPMTSVVIIVSWQWLPFAALVLLTALQSLDEEQKEAACLDGAGSLDRFCFITLPHLRPSISIVILVETIFFLSIFAEIFVTTSGGPGLATTTLAFLIYTRALLEFDVGAASAGGVVAVVLANGVAIFLVRTVARSLDARG